MGAVFRRLKFESGFLLEFDGTAWVSDLGSSLAFTSRLESSVAAFRFSAALAIALTA